MSAVLQQSSKEFAERFSAYVHGVGYHEAIRAYKNLMQLGPDPEFIAELGLLDRYFLTAYTFGRVDVLHPWLYDRCRMIEAEPDGCIDLWARFHYKSTFITYAGIIQEILRNPNITIAIFSHTKGIAKKFLEQVKRELESERLIALYPDVLYQDPQTNSPRWSVDKGIIVKRDSNPKESTLDAWGLVDGQPTSAHYALRVYDDIVTVESVSTPDQIEKVNDRLDLSFNLGDGKKNREQFTGTRYSHGDTWQTLTDRGEWKMRVFPATDDGTMTGNPVFMGRPEWEALLRKTSTFTVACQQLLNPIAGSTVAFKEDWLQEYEIRPRVLNVYIMCDPAGTKNKTSDRTAIAVVGVDPQGNKYILDGLCHRMSLSERWVAILNLRRKWKRAQGVNIVEVGYERYGMQTDIEHFKWQMKELPAADKFLVKELNWTRDGTESKTDRVMRLEPDFRNGDLFVPYRFGRKTIKLKQRETKLPNAEAHALKSVCEWEQQEGDPLYFRLVLVNDGGEDKRTWVQISRPPNGKTSAMIEAEKRGDKHLIAKPIKRRDEEKKPYDVTEWVISKEYNLFPSIHPDFLDALSRMYDMEMVKPAGRFEAADPEPTPDF